MSKNDLLIKIWPFFLLFFLTNFIGLTLTEYYGRDELHLYFNEYYNHPFLDCFFKFYTDFATTYVFIGVLVYIILKKTWRNFLFLASSVALASLISSLIKRSLFIHVHRPTYYFSQRNIDLHLIDGVSSQIPYTFPSGHALMGTIIFFYLCLQTKNRWLQALFAILAFLVAVSRVYLSKHFVIDTIGGSFLGLFFVVFCYYLINTFDFNWLNKKIIPKK